MPTDRDDALGEVRALTSRYQAGGRDALEAFRDLVALLLGLTILAPRGAVRLFADPRRREWSMALGGWQTPGDPSPLRDGRFLRLSMSLYREPGPAGTRPKVEKSGMQYQADAEGERWIFRYDYLRHPPDPHPAAHVQVRGTLAEPVLAAAPLARVHFPTMRVSLEAVIRLLAEDFKVPCRTAPDVWRPVLAASEAAFLAILHRP